MIGPVELGQELQDKEVHVCVERRCVNQESEEYEFGTEGCDVVCMSGLRAGNSVSLNKTCLEMYNLLVMGS